MSDEEESGESEDSERETMPCEDAATSAVKQALKSAQFDDTLGVVTLADPSGDYRMAHHCTSLEDLQQTLEEIYDEQWYANVSFDGGEAVFEGDSAGYVGDVLQQSRFETFFAQFGQTPDGEVIVSAADLVAVAAPKIIRIDLEEVNDELIKYLAAHPEKMHDLRPRKFEELVAELFKSKGYEVELTRQSRDGGLDIIAISRNELGTVMLLIECKKYAATEAVGVKIVRELLGVVEQQKATKGIIATTSYFTKPAKAFHSLSEYRLGLADYESLCGMLNEWKRRKV